MSKKIGDLELYTVEELAELLDVQERTLRRFLREGTLKGRKLAGRWYITSEGLKAYFEETSARR